MLLLDFMQFHYQSWLLFEHFSFNYPSSPKNLRSQCDMVKCGTSIETSIQKGLQDDLLVQPWLLIQQVTRALLILLTREIFVLSFLQITRTFR